ncbi:TonB-dependent receptor plug domain-containing protein [Litoribacter populi]|uniref:TonB-dependent receptor plug domain-containing protein n=1 Tax=Litoribacter populi TaxID=2598460 RepID=UPI00117D28D2|nr:TonB-dependent receptor plug domain-containing protein [Litoribacter populi]
MRKLNFLITLLSILITSNLTAQELTQKLEENLKIYRESFNPEKVYLQLDKPHYMGGEIVWLKAYVLQSSSLKATERSGVLYVDLIDHAGDLVEKLTLPISEGEAYGDISLSDDLQAGNYKITAYTRWMRNFGEETFFQKEIQILDEDSDVEQLEQKARPVQPQKQTAGGLQIEIDGKNINVSIENIDTEDVTLLVISSDKVVYRKAITEEEPIRIPKEEFNNGIAKFSLIDLEGEQVTEKLFFIEKEQTVSLSAETDKESYSSREEVQLSLDALGLEEGALAKVSLAVTVDNFVPYIPDQENILSYLYLSSELKNPLPNAGNYFSSSETDRQDALQELLQDQSLKRYDWEEIISGKFPQIRYGNEQEINIRGNLVKNGKPVENGEALLWLKDRFQTFVSTNTDEDGEFAFRGFYYAGEIPVVIQGSDHRGRREQVEVIMTEDEYKPSILDTRIRLQSKPPKNYTRTVMDQFRRTEAEIGAMELGELLLDEIVVEGRSEIHKPFRLHTQPDMVLFRKQLPVAPSGNILESLQGRVAGLRIIRRGMNEFTATIRGQGTPMYLLDGMPIPESTLQMINPFDISRVEIIRRPSAAGIYGGRGGGGVIAMFTDIGYEEEIDIEGGKHIVVHQAQGFSRTRNFYSPTHEDMDYYDLPDLRSTIYWNPSIHLKNEERKTLNFYTSDAPGTYRVIIEGVSEDGEVLREVVTFEVGN